MIIPTTNLESFARDLRDQCNVSRVDRINQNAMMTNYALCGGEDSQRTALYNKTYAYLDDLASLLYSPVSLRFHIGDPDVPNILMNAKGRAAASKLRSIARKSDTDTRISEATWWGLVKGKALLKSAYKRDAFHSSLVQPENFGVRHENHNALDEDMEAFCHNMFISMEQFARMIWDRPDRDALLRKAQTYKQPSDGAPEDTQRQIVTGGLYPYQPTGSATPNNSRGIVDWMGSPRPSVDPKVMANMLELAELWVWNDKAEDWSTFQLIGDDLLIWPTKQHGNLFAYDKNTGQSNPELKGRHPFSEFCVNPMDGYFWGRSEILFVALLQEALNSRLDGINRIIKKIEDPSYKITGVAGVNQNALNRFKAPGGYWSDTGPNAKIEAETPKLPQELVAWIHEIERMFDEMGGLPPIARGHGDAGVRSHNHAETLVRMFSPRFKDRALLCERDVEGLGGTMLDMAKAHVSKKLVAWVPQDQAGEQAAKPDPFMPPPTPGQVAIWFQFSDLDEDCALTIDSHSSSPAFAAEAKALTFDLFKIGAMSAEDVLERSEVTDPQELMAGVERRALAKQQQEHEALLVKGAHKK